MVSNARLDLPDPDRPVSTVSVSRGISTSTFLRLCSRAPRMEMFFSIKGSFQVRTAKIRPSRAEPDGRRPEANFQLLQHRYRKKLQKRQTPVLRNPGSGDRERPDRT